MRDSLRLSAALWLSMIFPATALCGTSTNGQSAPPQAPVTLTRMEPHLDIPPEVKEMYYTPGKPLMGNITHSELLPPVEQSLRAGSRFDETMLSSIRPDDLWMWVPPWLTGTFSTIYHKQLFAYDFTRHRFRHDTVQEISISHDTFGQQKDKHGNVWTYLGCPYSNRIMTGTGYVYQIYSHVEPVTLSSKCIVFRALYSAAHVDLRTHVISRVVQYEGLSSRKPIDASHVLVEDSYKIFDQDGHPLTLTHTTAIALKNSDYTQQRWSRGVDLRASLKSFLLSRGLESLVP